ncbi:MAG: putative DNA-binding domain-containing protein [Rhodobacteraceae bacterium]|nr:putative DNA-binding domain-containing protein [Paracoccaceae bacterium]
MLPELQARFRDTVLGNEDAVASYVTAARGSAANRIAVYRNTVQTSLTDVLATAYPVVRRIVGEKFFATLAHRYIAAHPPRIPQLSAYGGALADFIAGAEPLRELPYLADVARLEWTRGEAYFAANTPILDPVALSEIQPENLSALVLTPHPATRLVVSPFPIHRIWSINQPEINDVPKVDMSVAEAVLVTRPGDHIVTRLVGTGDAAFVARTIAGAGFGDAVAAAVTAEPAFDLQAALEAHLTNGTFAGIA